MSYGACCHLITCLRQLILVAADAIGECPIPFTECPFPLAKAHSFFPTALFPLH